MTPVSPTRLPRPLPNSPLPPFLPLPFSGTCHQISERLSPRLLVVVWACAARGLESAKVGGFWLACPRRLGIGEG
eukprot:12744343-Alexandrium_andersonii.AAC.1